MLNMGTDSQRMAVTSALLFLQVMREELGRRSFLVNCQHRIFVCLTFCYLESKRVFRSISC